MAMARAVVFCGLVALLGVRAQVRAQTGYDIEGLRTRAHDWGFARLETTSGDVRSEIYCPPALACDETSPEHVVLRFDHGALALLSARRARWADGWDVQVVVQPTLSGSFTLVYERGPERLALARDLTVEHFDFGVSVPFTEEEAERGYAALVAEALAAYVTSPATMESYATARTSALRRTVRYYAGAYTTCDDPRAPGRFVERQGPTGTGMFDTCVRRVLTPEERVELLSVVDAEMDRRDAIVHAHARSFQRAARELLGLSLPAE